MKVLLINGSPNEKGCTYTALSIIADQLNAQAIQTEIVWIGKESVFGCSGCAGCRSSGKCVHDDVVNRIIEKAKTADGYVFGSPVHYASPSGAMLCVMDRLFTAGGRFMKLKPAASIVSARRAGTTAAYDALNKYIGINSMIMVPAPYWNNVHGSLPADVYSDKEGVYIMKSIASNMAWLLELLQLGQQNNLAPRKHEAQRTNFVR